MFIWDGIWFYFLCSYQYFLLRKSEKIKYLCAFDIYYDEIANITIDHRFEYHKSFIHSIILSSMYCIHVQCYNVTCYILHICVLYYEAFLVFYSVTILSRNIIFKRQYNTLEFLWINKSCFVEYGKIFITHKWWLHVAKNWLYVGY